ncbi:negative regulator of mitosis [Melanomma pulvis-pyrius CBS 109.77]|uniref:Negative regulator of mitosis n=1 Tax=Melanomma pulvis-pyrius CBS 109.77 TaxID=1314802 RepID=A0A6A6XYI8_9PLEO|nr:negative regulator of mitosis [Melanomma pulvis-pyrius CBS 109.77]
MAALRSIGLHKPAALRYLVAEGILPEHSTELDYTWETYDDGEAGGVTEELVTTEFHVVWARGGMVRRMFDFEIEQERVIQALLTWFPSEEPSNTASQGPGTAEYSGNDQSKTFLTQGTQPATDPNDPNDQPPHTVEVRSRALVVFLKSQAHVFFLSGATHIVNLPFEVERAFPAPRGLLLQRKIPRPDPVAPTPQMPSAPPNSFMTNTQSFLSQTFTHSLSQPQRRHGSSLGSSRATKPLKAGSTNSLFLEELSRTSVAASTEGLPRVFSFTDPLSELGLVVNVVTGNERGGLLTTNGSGHRRLEPINKAEEVLYVSPRNEIQFDNTGNDKPLILVVTANYESNIFTIWSAAYLEPKSISASRKQHISLPANKVRRRSSYGPTAPGTGATTPALRGSDRMRESFGGAGRAKAPPSSFNVSSQSKERLSDQAVEDALASQLNPDFDVSRLPKESRRVSSILSRAELSTSFDKTAFQDLATHRTSLGASFGASFGASQRSRHSLGNERMSFGGFSQSRNRASTPGSIASRMSMGGASVDDTLEDIMDEDTFDTLEDYDEIDDLFSPPDAGVDQEPMDGLRKELVMSPVAEIVAEKYLKSGLFNLNPAGSGSQTASKVFTVTAPFNSATLHERRLHVYILHSSLQNPLECEIAITRKRLPAISSQPKLSTAAPRYACVPRFIKTQEMKDTLDAIKVFDGHVERVVRLISTDPREPCLSLVAGWGTHLPIKFSLGPLELFNPHTILEDDQMRQMRATPELKRTINAQQPLQRIAFASHDGTFDIVDGESLRHRIELQLSPEDPLVAHIFRVLSTILSNYAGEFLLEIWWSIRQSLSVDSSGQANEDWIAFVTTLFSLAVPFIESKTVKPADREKSRQSRSSGRPLSQAKPYEITDDEFRRLLGTRQKSWESGAWAWIQQSHPSSMTMSPPLDRLSTGELPPISQQMKGKHDLIVSCAERARQFVQSPIGKATNDHWRRLSPSEKQDLRISCLSEIVVTLHLLREERKLDVLLQSFSRAEAGNLAPVLAQLGHWLNWESWGWRQGSYYDLEGGSAQDWSYEDSSFRSNIRLHVQPWDSPPSILEWISTMLRSRSFLPFPTLEMLIRKSKASPHSSVNIDEVISGVTPRTVALHKFFQEIDHRSNSRKTVELIERCGISSRMLATLPEAARAPLMEAITRCQANPPTTWSSSLLKLVQREDLDLSLTPHNEFLHDVHQNQTNAMSGIQSSLYYLGAARDVHTICQGVDRPELIQSVAEVERHYVTRLIFHEDRRFMEAYALLEPLKQSVAEYRPDNRVEEAAILEGQKTLMQWVMVRTFSLPVGSSMVKFSSKKPLLTEKYPLYGFSTSCLMKPMGNVVTAERANYSEEKYFWAFFNAGVAAGLSISRDAQGIDTSWIMYNKPQELTNKHAGLLLGLGLNGHLKTIAKWLSFKYLTPKHTMTSVGLLLGLSASFMGTMDTLVTRLLSVHVTRMLPPGAAELNLSPYTQTTGLMGIGLLYYNTQHRRMSEVMLSEIEHVDEIDPSEPPDTLRDEAYRLAAGFALGFINLGKGKDLRGLHDMRIVERLMTVAVAPKPVDIVHILDQATAGAVIAVALVFMKTHDEAVARKIDIPDTLPQFDYVRPDIFLLRTLAKHLIMWDNIRANHEWIAKNLPVEYRSDSNLKSIAKLRSDQMPFFNILAGLLWSVSLKHAGTGDVQVRDFLIGYLDQFIRISKIPALRYDSKLARNTVRNCQDLIALSAATVMAGTGDLHVFRRLRGLHGRVGPETPYGSHLAAHMAFGVLFIAGGTHTFSTSNKAIASLICAFYPLYPMDVQDSRAHLQAFRHFWVLAAEPRCLIVRDVDTGRATSMAVTCLLKDSTSRDLVAPCLLPELHTIARIETGDVAYWPTTLDFVNNPLHLITFRANQTIHVRRRSAHDMYASTFSATLVALNDAQVSRTTRLMWDWLFSLPALREFEKADIGLILPVDPYSSTFLDNGSTVVDVRLALKSLSESWNPDELWELRGLFEWAEGAAKMDGRLRWLGREVVDRLKAGILKRGRGIGGV